MISIIFSSKIIYLKSNFIPIIFVPQTIPTLIFLPYFRSHWYSNPHFRGSWSSETPEVGNVKGSPHSDLLQPIVGENGVPRILFAGEVTHPTRFSCVDGALDTGFMQADRLMKYYSGSRCS